MGVLVRGAVAAVVGLVLLACEPTQVLVTFDAEEETLLRAHAIQVRLVEQDGQVQELGPHAIEADGLRLPTTVPVSPRGGDASRAFRVVGELLEERADGELHVFSRQSARIHFAPNRFVAVELLFGDHCRDILCPDEFTCRDGLCIADARCAADDPATCPEGRVCIDGSCMQPTCARGEVHQADTDRCEPICGGEAGCASGELCSGVTSRCEPVDESACGIAPPHSPCLASCAAPEACFEFYGEPVYYCVLPCDPCAPACPTDWTCAEVQSGRFLCVLEIRGEGELCDERNHPCADGLICHSDGSDATRCARQCPAGDIGPDVGVAAEACAEGTLCFDESIAWVCREPASPVAMGHRKIRDCLHPQEVHEQSLAKYCTVACPNGDADCPGDLYCAVPARALEGRETHFCVQPGEAAAGVGCREDPDCMAGHFCDAAQQACVRRTP